jgi:hypothetical protein
MRSITRIYVCVCVYWFLFLLIPFVYVGPHVAQAGEHAALFLPAWLFLFCFVLCFFRSLSMYARWRRKEPSNEHAASAETVTRVKKKAEGGEENKGECRAQSERLDQSCTAGPTMHSSLPFSVLVLERSAARVFSFLRSARLTIPGTNTNQEKKAIQQLSFSPSFVVVVFCYVFLLKTVLFFLGILKGGNARSMMPPVDFFLTVITITFVARSSITTASGSLFVVVIVAFHLIVWLSAA